MHTCHTQQTQHTWRIFQFLIMKERKAKKKLRKKKEIEMLFMDVWMDMLNGIRNSDKISGFYSLN